MKNPKKALSVMLASTMVLAAASNAFADTYTVKKGDCLSKIAPKYNTTWQTLADINKLANPNLIFPNQILQVPDIKKAAPEVKTETPKPETAPVKAEEKAALTSLDVTTMDSKHITPAFSANVKAYSITVQSDIYAVLVNPQAAEGSKITVTASVTPGAYGGEDKNEPMVIEKGEKGYVVPLSQTYESYNSKFVQTATITVEKGNSKENYTLTITRENDSDIYAKFKADKFKAKDGTEIEYNIYVPSNYDSSKKYPVVLALHGSGQMTQPVDMILKRYQMATAFAKDSENGINECIVVAPQAKSQWNVTEKINDSTYPTGVPSAENEAAYELLQNVKKTYSVDKNRIYLTGLSMGAMGSETMAYNHPDEFAAVVLDASRDFADPSKIDYSIFKKLSGKIYYFHAEDDPTCSYESGASFLENLTKAGVEYKSTIYPSGTFFYPSAHFSWVPCYADSSMRNWMFEQKK